MLAVVTVIADVNFEKVYVAMETYARTQMYEESSCVSVCLNGKTRIDGERLYTTVNSMIDDNNENVQQVEIKVGMRY